MSLTDGDGASRHRDRGDVSKVQKNSVFSHARIVYLVNYFCDENGLEQVSLLSLSFAYHNNGDFHYY